MFGHTASYRAQRRRLRRHPYRCVVLRGERRTRCPQQLALRAISLSKLSMRRTQRARRYVETIADRSVAPTAGAVADLSKFHEPFPGTGRRAERDCRDARRIRLTCDDREHGSALFWICHRRLYAGRHGGELDRQRVGSERLHASDVPGGVGAGRDCARVGLRSAASSGGCAGGLMTSATMANFTGLIDGALCAARESGMERQRRRNVWRAADRRRCRRRDSCALDESARAGRIRKEASQSRRGRCAGPDARRQISEGQRSHDCFSASGQREHRLVRSGARNLSRARRRMARGCTSMARSDCGLRRRRSIGI